MILLAIGIAAALVGASWWLDELFHRDTYGNREPRLWAVVAASALVGVGVTVAVQG